MSLDIGRLDKPIRFSKPVEVVQASGEAVTTWATQPMVHWATYAPTPTRTRHKAPYPMPAFSGSLTLRYVPVDPSWRVEMDGELWAITSVSDYNRREYVVLTIERQDG